MINNIYMKNNSWQFYLLSKEKKNIVTFVIFLFNKIFIYICI